MNLTSFLAKAERKQLRRAAGALALAAFLSFNASATAEVADPSDGALRLEDLEINVKKVSALTQAPTDSNLLARQPQSILSLEYITNNMAPTADYATIVALAPSVSNVETNGPGLSEAKHTTVRGIDDGGYNVTFDGIPFGDYNSYSHHTTSYFPAKLIGRVVLDRGPGTASTIGLATFGGTLGLYSKDPRPEASFVPTLSAGSFGTKLGHFEFNTGRLGALQGGSAIASYQRMETDGYRTNADMKRDTYFLKYEQPVGKDTVVTVLSSVNKISFGNPGTVTQAQINQFGRNFGLKDDLPANHLDLLNRKYNYQDKTADFEYLGVVTKLGAGWSLDNKVYTYSYDNISHEKPKVGSGAAAGQMLGSVKGNEYRTYGDTFQVVHEDDRGTFKAGLWYDSTTNHRYTYGVNYDTTGADTIDLTPAALYKAAAPGGNPATLPGGSAYNYKYLLVDKDRTVQAYTEYLWKITPDFDLNGGVSYQKFSRDFDATVNQTAGRQALVASRSDSKALPSISAHYTIRKNWTAYAQWAQGIMALSEANSFYVANANLGAINVKPQLSTNYQVGTVYQHDRFNADFDAYYVDFKNYAYSGPADASGDPSYYGVARGAYYRGFEFEATYFLGAGLSLYGNGSLNQARFKGSDMNVPTVPRTTGAFGFVFDHAGLFGSFTEKYVGRWVVYDTVSNPDLPGAGASRTAYSDAYWLGDLSLGYAHKFEHGLVHSVKIRFQVGNLFNQKVQVLDGIDSNPANFYAKDAFNVLPTRNYFVTASFEL